MDSRKSRMAKNIRHKIKNLKIHSDSRGWLIELLKANEIEKPLKQLHIASIKPGFVRGNHYHKKRIEWLFLVSGKAKVVLEDVATKKRKNFIFNEKSPKVLSIFPGISHAVKNIGTKNAYIISAQSDIFNPKKPDKTLYKVIE